MPHPHFVRCIYCKEMRPPSKEHVLQASLGGNLTIQCVCQDCNGGFSKIDQSLAENSFVALSRVGTTQEPSMDVQLGGNHFFEQPPGVWNDLKIKNRLRAVLLPQIHLVSMGEQAELGVVAHDKGDLDKFIALVDKKVADGSLLAVHVKIGPLDRCSTSRLVGYRSNALYVRASSEEAGSNLLKLLNDNWLVVRAHCITSPFLQAAVAQPSVKLTMSMCLDDNYRAVAKIAFNLLAVRKGANFVLRPEFDSLRNYINGIGLVHEDPLPEGEVAVDTRFVQPIPHDEKPLIPTDSHAVAFMYYAPELWGMVTLYKTSSFIVRLAEIALDEPMMIEGHEFSTDRTSNLVLDSTELATRLWKRERG